MDIWADRELGPKDNSLELTAAILLMRDPSSKQAYSAAVVLPVEFHHKA